MNITKERCLVFKNETKDGDRTYYRTTISRRNPDGTYENAPITVRFKKGLTLMIKHTSRSRTVSLPSIRARMASPFSKSL